MRRPHTRVEHRMTRRVLAHSPADVPLRGPKPHGRRVAYLVIVGAVCTALLYALLGTLSLVPHYHPAAVDEQRAVRSVPGSLDWTREHGANLGNHPG